MLRLPKRYSYRKVAKRGRIKGFGSGMLIRGDRGLVSASFGRRSARQLEAARRAIRHHLARQGQLWILSFPQRPITAKPAEVRMGGGVGSISYWAAYVKPGTVRFELRGVERSIGEHALRSGAKKLPFSSVRVERERGRS
jgi:large subunit ribosomal protein L16